MPSQSRVHIGPLETSFSPRPEAEMLMRSWWETKGAGGREGRQTVLPYRFLLRRNRCSAPTLAVGIRERRTLHLFGNDRLDRIGSVYRLSDECRQGHISFQECWKDVDWARIHPLYVSRTHRTLDENFQRRDEETYATRV